MENIRNEVAELKREVRELKRIVRSYEPVIIHFSKQNVLQWFILLLAMTSIIMQLIK